MSKSVLNDVDAFLAEKSDSDEEGAGDNADKPLLATKQEASPPAPPADPAAKTSSDEEDIPRRFEPKKKLQSDGKLKRTQIIGQCILSKIRSDDSGSEFQVCFVTAAQCSCRRKAQTCSGKQW